jgi:hypothetical protein
MFVHCQQFLKSLFDLLDYTLYHLFLLTMAAIGSWAVVRRHRFK